MFCCSAMGNNFSTSVKKVRCTSGMAKEAGPASLGLLCWFLAEADGGVGSAGDTVVTMYRSGAFVPNVKTRSGMVCFTGAGWTRGETWKKSRPDFFGGLLVESCDF